MRDYVSQIAGADQSKPLHKFEYSSHVLKSANNLLKRMIVADAVNCNQDDSERFALNLYRSAYGRSRDSLAQFDVVFGP